MGRTRASVRLAFCTTPANDVDARLSWLSLRSRAIILPVRRRVANQSILADAAMPIDSVGTPPVLPVTPNVILVVLVVQPMSVPALTLGRYQCHACYSSASTKIAVYVFTRVGGLG